MQANVAQGNNAYPANSNYYGGNIETESKAGFGTTVAANLPTQDPGFLPLKTAQSNILFQA